MSRIHYTDIDDVRSLLSTGRWEQNIKTSLAGKRGQVALKKLEQALLALPRSLDGRGRLIEGALVQPTPQLEDEYETCALGALALYEGKDPLELFLRWGDEDSYDAYDIMEIGPDLGISKTMAWAIMEENDEMFGGFNRFGKPITPEERWEKMLAWVRKQIKEA